jgi:hypothetical protein
VKVECEVYSWSPGGMKKWDGYSMGWIRKSDAEKLLLAARQRGKTEGLARATEIIKETPSG